MNYRGKVLNHYANWRTEKTEGQGTKFEKIKARLTILDNLEKLIGICHLSYRNLNTEEKTLENILNTFNIYSEINGNGYIEFWSVKTLDINEDDWNSNEYEVLIVNDDLEVEILKEELQLFISKEFKKYSSSTLKLEL